MTTSKHQQVIRDEAEAEQRQEDAKSEAGLEGQAQDSKRYRYLRDAVQNSDGSVNEKLYVRCDGRVDGKWALYGEDLDKVLDLLLINRAEAEKAAAKAAREEKAAAKGR
jgi:hypothetical protein